MWYYNKALLLFLLKELNKMQQRAVLQILDTFCTSLSSDIEAFPRLILIYLHLRKLSRRAQLRSASLPSNHIIKDLFESRYTNNSSQYQLSLENIKPKQRLKVKSFISNSNNHLNSIFPSFDSLNDEISPGNRLINIF